MRLQVRIVLIIVAALLPPLCMQVFNEQSLRRAREADVREQALREARGVAAELDRIVAGVRNALVAMAEVPAIRDGDAAACARLLVSVNARLAFQRDMALVGADGRTLCDSRDSAVPADRSGSTAVRLARQRGAFAIGSYEVDQTGRSMLPMAYPVSAAPGPGAVLVADIDLGWVRDQIVAHGLPPNSSVTVADRDMTYLVRLPNADRVGQPMPPEIRPLVDAGAPAAVESLSSDGLRRIVGYIPLAAPPRDLFISVGFSTDRAYAASDAAALRGYGLIAAGLAAALVLATWLLRGLVARPALAILATTERWSRGDTSARVAPIGAGAEFSRIALAVNGLLDAAASTDAGLRARLAELDAVYRGSPVGLGFIGPDLRFITVNGRLAEFNGLSAEGHRGRTPREVFPARIVDASEQRIRRVLAGERVPPVEIIGITDFAPGTPRLLLVSYQPAVAPDGQVLGVVAAVQDITALRRAEAALQDTLQRANAELERRVVERTRQLEDEVQQREVTRAQLQQAQKMELIGQLTGGVAHDFNNLLTAIIGNLELAQVRARELPEVARLLQAAMRAADRGASLTQHMLAFARRQYLRFQPVEIPDLLAGCTDLLATSLGPGVEIRVAAPAAMRPAWADPNQVELLLLNLAVNARDAMPDGGVVAISAAEEHVTDADSHPAGLAAGAYVRIAVADTGRGMDAATRARAFEPFFTTKPVGQGSGLGLSMVQGVADQSGGGVAITSAPGKGTTVTVWLPCADIEATAATAAEPPPLPAPARGQRVLLVDDDLDVLAFAAICLEDAGYATIRADTAEAALALLATSVAECKLPNLLIADLGLPGMSGIQLVSAARRLVPALPVLIATGYADDEVSGTTQFPVLGKPFKAAELLAQVAALLGPITRAAGG